MAASPAGQTAACALRTNLLLPLTNVGVEVPLGRRCSLAADLYFPWIQREWVNVATASNNIRCTQVFGGFLDGRYWFSSDQTECPRQWKGHSLGLILGGGIYDFERPFDGVTDQGMTPEGEGRQGYGLVAGVGYLYALPLGNDKVWLEFEVAVGFVHSCYDTYYVYSQEDGRAFRYGDGQVLNSFCPLKCAVNLTFPIGQKAYGSSR